MLSLASGSRLFSRSRRIFVIPSYGFAREKKTTHNKNVLSLADSVINRKVSVEDLSEYEVNNMFYVLGKVERDSERLFNFYDLVKDSFPISPNSYRYLFLNCGKKEEKTKQLLHDVNVKQIESTPSLLGGLLINMLQQKKIDRALKIAKQLIENGNLAWFECSVLVRDLINEKRFEEAKQIYADANTNYEFIMFHKLILSSIEKRNFDLALYWYQELRKYNVTLDRYALESLFTGCISAQNYTMIYSIADDNNELTVPMYESIFIAIRKDPSLALIDEKVSLAASYFRKFLDQKLPLDKNSSLLERVLEIFIKSEDPNVSKDFLETLHSHHFTIQPSMIYRISDKFRDNKDLFPVILKMLYRVRDKGTPAVQSIIFYKIMTLHCNSQNISKALQAFREMKFAKLAPNSVIYSRLISACCDTKKIDEAFELKKQCVQDNISINRQLYTHMVDRIADAHYEQFIPKLVDEMNHVGFRLDIDSRAIRDINNAIKDAMPETTLANPPRRTSDTTEAYYNLARETLLLLYQSKFSEAWQKLNSFKDIDMKIPSFLSASWIRFQGKNGSLSDVVAYFNENKSDGVDLYEAMMDVYASKQQHDKVLELFNDFVAKKLQPTLGIYNLALSTLRRNNSMEETMKILGESTQSEEIQPNETTIKELVSGYCKQGNLQQAQKIIENSHSNLLVESAFNELAQAYLDADKPELAENLLKLIDASELTLPLIQPIINYYHKKNNASALQNFISYLQANKVSRADIVHSFPTSVHANEYLKD